MNTLSIAITLATLVIAGCSACTNNSNDHTSSTGGGGADRSGNYSNGGGMGGAEEYPSTGDDMVTCQAYPVCPDNTYEVSTCPTPNTCTEVSICAVTITCAPDTL